MPDDDSITKIYEAIEQSASRASKAVNSLIEGTKQIGKIGGGNALNFGYGAMAVGPGLYNTATSKNPLEGYKNAIIEVKGMEAQTRLFGATLEKVGSLTDNFSKKIGSAFKSWGTSAKENYTFASQFEEIISKIGKQSNILAKTMTQTSQVFKVAFGPASTVFLTTYVAYKEFVDKSIDLSDKLIEKQKEVATSFKEISPNSSGMPDSYRTGKTFTQVGAAAQSLYAQGVPGGRMAAVTGMQQGADLGININVSSQIISLASQIAQAQGKALEPVLRDVFSKAAFSFVGKSPAEQSNIITQQQLLMGIRDRGPSMRDAYTEALTGAGERFGRARDNVSDIGRTFSRLAAGSRYDYEESPLYSAITTPFRRIGERASKLPGKAVETFVGKPLEAISKTTDVWSNIGTDVLGGLLQWGATDSSRRKILGAELQTQAAGGRASAKATDLTKRLGNMRKELSEDTSLKEFMKLQTEGDEAKKKISEGVLKMKDLSARNALMDQMTPEDRKKHVQEMEELSEEIQSARATDAKAQQSLLRSGPSINKYKYMTSEERKRNEEIAKGIEDKAAAYQAVIESTKLAKSAPRQFELSLPEATNVGTLTAEFEASQSQYIQNVEEMEKLKDIVESGGGSVKQLKRYQELQAQVTGFGKRWVSYKNQEKYDQYTTAQEKLQNMLEEGAPDKEIKKQQKIVSTLKETSGVQTGEERLKQLQDIEEAKVGAQLKGLSKATEAGSLMANAEKLKSLGLINEEGFGEISGILGGGYDKGKIEKAFAGKDTKSLSELFKGNLTEDQISKYIESGDLSTMMTQGIRISPSDMKKARGLIQLKGTDYQTELQKMETSYIPKEMEIQGKGVEFGVKQLQNAGKIAEDEIQKISELIAKKDALSLQEAQKVLGFAEKRYQLEEQTIQLQAKSIEREGTRTTTGMQIGFMQARGKIETPQTDYLQGTLGKLQGSDFDKAAPIVQNILNVQEQMYQKELEFTKQYTESRMNIIQAHYEKSINLEKMKIEAPEARIRPAVQYGQGMIQAFQPYNAAMANRYGIQEQMIGQARQSRSLQEDQMMMQYQMAGVEVPRSLQMGMAMRGQMESQADFVRQMREQRRGDVEQLGQIGDVFGNLGKQGIDYKKLSETEGGRGLLNQILGQSQGALMRQKGIDVTPLMKDLAGKQFELEGRKYAMDQSGLEKTGKMYEEQISEMEKNIEGVPKDMQTQLRIGLGGKYKEAAEYYRSTGQIEQYERSMDKYIETQKELPDYLKGVKDEGSKLLVEQSKEQIRLLENISQNTGVNSNIDIKITKDGSVSNYSVQAGGRG